MFRSSFFALLVFAPILGFSASPSPESLNKATREFAQNQIAIINCGQASSGYEYEECLRNALTQVVESLEKQLTKEQFKCWTAHRFELCSNEAALHISFFNRRWFSCMAIYDLRLAGVLISRDTKTQTNTRHDVEEDLVGGRDFKIIDLERHMQGLAQQMDPDEPVQWCAPIPIS